MVKARRENEFITKKLLSPRFAQKTTLFPWLRVFLDSLRLLGPDLQAWGVAGE